MGDREAMRLVADALDQEHAWRVVLLHDRLRPARREDLLALLGQREGWDVGETRLLEHLQRCSKLALAAVDEDQVWTALERPVAGRGCILPAARGLESLQGALQHLLQHPEVVGSRHVL